MSQPLSAVSVEVTADDTPARREIERFQRQVSNLTSEIKVEADTSSLRKLPAEAAAIGEPAGKALGEGIKAGAGDSADGITRDVSSRLRNARGQFVAAGTSAGRALGEGIEAGATSQTEGLGRKLAGPIATGLGLVAAGAGIAGAALTAFGLKSAAELEQVQVAFNSLTGSAAEGQRVFTELQKFAATTPFEFPEVANAAKRLLAMGQAAGISRDELQGVLTTIGNVASVTGGGAQALDSVTLAMGQMASSGKITLENLNQISEAMPGFSGVAAIAAATGKTTAQVMEDISAGELDAKTGIDALLKGMAQFPGAAGAMEAQAQTLLGTFSTFKDTLSQALVGAFQPVIPDVKEALSGLTPVLGDAFKTLGPVLGDTLTSVMGLLGPAVTALTALFEPIFGALSEALSTIDLGQLTAPFAALGNALAPVIGILGNLIELVLAELAPAIQIAAEIFGPLIRVISSQLTPIIQQTFLPAIQKLTPVLIQLGILVGSLLAESFEEILPPILALIPALVSQLLPVVINLAQEFIKLLPTLAPIGRELLSAMLPAITSLLPVLTPLITLFSQLLLVAIKIIVPLEKLILQFLTFLTSKAIVPLIKGIADGLVFLITPLTKIVPFFESLGGTLGGIDWGGIGSAIAGGFMSALRAVGDFFTSIGQFLASVPGRIVAFLSSLPQLLGDLFTNAIQFAFTALGRGIGLIYTLVTEAPGKIGEFLSRLPGIIAGAFDAAITAGLNALKAGLLAIGNFILTAIAFIGTTFNNLKFQVISTFLSMITGARDLVVNGFNSIVNFIFTLPSKLAALGPQLLRTGVDLINSLMNGIAGFGSKAFGFIAQIVSSIKSFINTNVIGALEKGLNDTLPFDVRLPRLARGAIVTEPTVAQIGEAGPEVVIPLTRPARARELADDSGLSRMLGANGGGGLPPIAVTVYATLGTGQVIEILDQRVDVKLADTALALDNGPRW